jgi:hypothetical protein
MKALASIPFRQTIWCIWGKALHGENFHAPTASKPSTPPPTSPPFMKCPFPLRSFPEPQGTHPLLLVGCGVRWGPSSCCWWGGGGGLQQLGAPVAVFPHGAECRMICRIEWF